MHREDVTLAASNNFRPLGTDRETSEETFSLYESVIKASLDARMKVCS